MLTGIMAMLLLFLFAEPNVNNNYYLAATIAKDTAINCIEDSIIVLPNEKTNTVVNLKSEASCQYGFASFYSANLEGTETSTQETFTHSKLTCASNRYKLHTWLRVTNVKNNKSIIVRVNDRMHPRMDAKGRVVDLSYIGAKKLGFIDAGVTKVKVEVVEKGTKI